ncbi:MAG: PilZ domain-containing protein [Candidatus Omnitrophica bacterium]|nr:PilZ domain-containing protein [Candidatus Omnitrophota bacterium]
MWNIIKKIFSRTEAKGHRAYRLYESLYVDYQVVGRKQNGHGEGLDISESAIRFASEEPLRKGDLVDLELCYQAHHKEPKRLKVSGRVEKCYRKRKQHRYRTVCRFIGGIDEQFLRELRAFIEWLVSVKEHLHFRYGKHAD